MVSNVMEVRHVLGDSEAGQYFACSSVCAVGRDGSDDLNSFRSGEMEHRAATHAIDSNSVDEVSVPVLLTGADIPGEEAEVVGSDGGEPKPANLGPDVDAAAHWKKCYGALWDLKIAFEKQNYR